MTRIEILDKAAEKETRYSETGVNPTFGAAYFYSIEAENDLINFAEVIWDYDIDPILEDCKKFGITQFTISSTFSSLIATIAEFEKRGCHLAGLTEVNDRYGMDWDTGKRRQLPAFKMVVA